MRPASIWMYPTAAWSIIWRAMWNVWHPSPPASFRSPDNSASRRYASSAPETNGSSNHTAPTRLSAPSRAPPPPRVEPRRRLLDVLDPHRPHVNQQRGVGAKPLSCGFELFDVGVD